MSVQAILLPLFAHVALVFVLLFAMGGFRAAAVQRGEVRLPEVALREPKWPRRPTQFAYAFSNQFEIPVLFYVLVVLALFTRKADLLFVVLSWVFVLARWAQAAIHVTHNTVSQRGLVYVAGVLVLLLMWIIFAVRVLLGL